MKKKELVKADSHLPAHFRGKEALVAEAFDEMKDSIDLRLPQIKILAGGANIFQKGEGTTFTELKCIILGSSKAYAFWLPKEEDTALAFWEFFGGIEGFEPEESEFPLCSSMNGETGNHYQISSGKFSFFGNCNQCHFNQFKSDLKGGKGKACKNGRRLLILLPDSTIPNQLTLPPTSIRAFDNYYTSLFELRTPMMFVYTTIQLEKRETAEGKPYSVAKFVIPEKFETISAEDMETVEELRRQYLRLIKESPFTREEFNGESNGKSGQPIEVDAEVV